MQANFQDGVDEIVSAINTKAGTSLTRGSTPAQIVDAISSIPTIRTYSYTSNTDYYNPSVINIGVNHKAVYFVPSTIYSSKEGNYNALYNYNKTTGSYNARFVCDSMKVISVSGTVYTVD